MAIHAETAYATLCNSPIQCADRTIFFTPQKSKNEKIRWQRKKRLPVDDDNMAIHAKTAYATSRNSSPYNAPYWAIRTPHPVLKILIGGDDDTVLFFDFV